MSDFLSRLVAKSSGEPPAVQPRVAPPFGLPHELGRRAPAGDAFAAQPESEPALVAPRRVARPRGIASEIPLPEPESLAMPIRPLTDRQPTASLRSEPALDAPRRVARPRGVASEIPLPEPESPATLIRPLTDRQPTAPLRAEETTSPLSASPTEERTPPTEASLPPRAREYERRDLVIVPYEVRAAAPAASAGRDNPSAPPAHSEPSVRTNPSFIRTSAVIPVQSAMQESRQEQNMTLRVTHPSASPREFPVMSGSKEAKAAGVPPVHVTIGRIEVRAALSTSGSSERKQTPPATMSLEEYVRRRARRSGA